MARKVTGLLNLPPLTDVLALLPQQVGRKVLERTLPPGEVFKAPLVQLAMPVKKETVMIYHFWKCSYIQ